MQNATAPAGAAPPRVAPGDGFDVSQFYEQIISLVPGIVYVFNHVMQANEFSNRSIGTLLGYSSQELLDMGDAVVNRVVHPEDQALVGAYFASLRDLADGDTASIDYRGIRSDGATVWLRSCDTVFQRAEDGSVLRHIGVASDVTEQVNKTKRLAEINDELGFQKEKLQDTNRELEQFTYIATHDLKSPLSNLSLLIQNLQEELEEPSDDIGDILGWMQISCQQANDKLNALVRVAQTRSGEREPSMEVDLAEALEATCNGLRGGIEATGARIESDFSAAPNLFFPPFEVFSLLENLVDNALKYRHPDRPLYLHMRSAVIDNAVQLIVRDNGRGLTLPRDEEKVFGLFKRAHVSPPGNGVALYTIRKLLERVGGEISVDSEKGEWTEFCLTFPMQETGE